MKNQNFGSTLQNPASVFLIVLYFFCNSRNANNESVAIQIDSLRVKFNIPAVAYGIIRNDSIIVQNVIGYRNIETMESAKKNDYFHIGSNTKSFTAFIAGKIVENGLLNWETKFFDLLPEMKRESKPEYHDMTLQDLLSHRARLISFRDDSDVYPIVDYEKKLDSNFSLQKKRSALIQQILKYEPIPPYDHHDDRYSNAGYIAAALMLEKVTGKDWEQIITETSDKLDLNIHIGWPDSDNPEQPQGHINPKDWLIDMDKELIPIPFNLLKYHYFNQHILLCTPSGHLSITIRGFLKFLKLHLDGFNGKDNYLKSETYKHLISSHPDYSLGWASKLYGKTYYHHRGSAGTFNSIAILIPNYNLGIVIMTNTYSGRGINEMAKLLISKYAL